ncbi:gp53-like domain-containing protein [Serratia proteamaculans]|uniref:gp53-like domain-containing protein n=1 Tax=Serratia proteamaculans TaxID=28151 RepID=UPI001F0E645B|nr:hypothetical protein [Serratia proteamaculans]
MIIGFGNNVVSSLAADITATQTTIQVMPGTGTLFAGLLTYDYANDSNPLKTYAKITLTDAKETVFEVCHLTSANNDMLTVVRGQEGTAAKGWSLNDVIANFATRGSENQFVQIEQLQSGHYTSAVAGGTENGLTLALPATYFLNNSTDWALKTPILIYPTLNNTGASTLQLTMGGRVIGTYPLVKGSNTALRAGDIVAKNPFLVVFNADQGRFALLNPTTSVGAVLTVNTHTPDAAGNVKLGTAADADVGTASGNVMAVGAFGLGRGSNHKDDAYNNVGEIFRVNGTSANTPTTGVAGVISLPCDGGPSTAYVAVSNAGAAWVGSSSIPVNGVKWYRVYTTDYKPTASDVGAWSKGESDNRYLIKNEGGIIEKPITIRNTGGSMLSMIRGEQGGVGGQFIGGYNNDGSRLWWMGSADNGVRDVSLYSDAWQMGVSITQNGINADGNLLERGARVYSPYNPPPSQTSASLASNGWWRDNGTGMIYQWVNGINLSSAGGSSEGVNFPISFPRGCLSVNVSVKGAASEQIGWDNATNSSVIVIKGSGDGTYPRIANIFVIGY